MEIVRSARPIRQMAEVTMWHCAGCRVVHMSLRDMVLNFTREEFAAFTEAVVDINYSGWDSCDGNSVIDLSEHDSDRFANVVLH